MCGPIPLIFRIDELLLSKLPAPEDIDWLKLLLAIGADGSIIPGPEGFGPNGPTFGGIDAAGPTAFTSLTLFGFRAFQDAAIINSGTIKDYK